MFYDNFDRFEVLKPDSIWRGGVIFKNKGTFMHVLKSCIRSRHVGKRNWNDGHFKASDLWRIATPRADYRTPSECAVKLGVLIERILLGQTCLVLNFGSHGPGANEIVMPNIWILNVIRNECIALDQLSSGFIEHLLLIFC